MKTMIAKYPGKCFRTGKQIKAGDTIAFYGRGRAELLSVYTPIAEHRAPCWICQSPAGKFRNLGAASPVWCDVCFAREESKEAADSARFARRDNSSHEDASCGDRAYEDSCAAACGL